MNQKNRKPLSILLICALVLISLACDAAAEPQGGIDEILAAMPLRDKLAQMMFFSPRTWKDDPESEEPAENIHALNDAVRQYIADHRFGGMVVFGQNVSDAEQLARLIADAQSANQEGGGLPMLVAADEEGGLIARLSFGTRGVGAMALAATGDAENIDTGIDSPYNTYINAGLTPTPISNPGLSSINAALDFADTNYYYYVLNPETQLHQFSKTYEEHQEWIEKFRGE